MNTPSAVASKDTLLEQLLAKNVSDACVCCFIEF